MAEKNGRAFFKAIIKQAQMSSIVNMMILPVQSLLALSRGKNLIDNLF